MRKLISLIALIAMLVLAALPAAAQELEDEEPLARSNNLDALVGVDGFANSCDTNINYAGFTVRFAEAGEITVRGQAYTDYYDETNVIGNAAAGQTVSFTVNGPKLPEDSAVQFTISNGTEGSEIYVNVNCTTGEVFLQRVLGYDGRLFGGNDLTVVIFPKLDSDNQPFLDFYTAIPDGIGRRTLRVTAEELAALPENPDTNILVDVTRDNIATLYKLTSGEFQVNFAATDEGVVWVLVFDDVSPTRLSRADFRTVQQD